MNIQRWLRYNLTICCFHFQVVPLSNQKAASDAIFWLGESNLKIRRLSFVVGIALLSANTTFSNAESPCVGFDTQSGLSQCAVLEMEKADAELTHVYKRLMAELEPKKKQQLKIAERAWIAYRDESCEFIGLERDGGSMQGMTIAMCRTDLIKEQTSRLIWQLNCRLSQQDCAKFAK
jgi:uncharacterized protein YecT (DUF1311 family)